MKTKYSYKIEFLVYEKCGNKTWYSPPGLQETQRAYLLGYLHGQHDSPPPRLAMRLIRSDGKVIEEYEANDDVGIGMIAGWPTPEQYEQAAKKALELAKRIRETNHRSNH